MADFSDIRVGSPVGAIWTVMSVVRTAAVKPNFALDVNRVMTEFSVFFARIG